MLESNQKLASSLAALHRLQGSGRHVFRSSEFTRVQRERLLRNGFVQEVIKGWLISSSPDTRPGDSTPWYASLWEFCASYSGERFGDEWHLSPEQSLLLHAENTDIPRQVVIYSPLGTNNQIELPFNTSIYDLKQSDMPAPQDSTVRGGLRLYTKVAALIRVPDSFFVRYPAEAQAILCSIAHPTELLRRLLDGGHSVIAGRLAGAFRRVGRPGLAEELMTTMKAAGYDARETDPFASTQTLEPLHTPVATPIAIRLEAMWSELREGIVKAFPPSPGLPHDKGAYLNAIDELYKSDAYHSLSIEGYHVSQELIERVRQGDWNPDIAEADRRSRDALAARGYWQAFQSVRESIAAVIRGADSAALVRTAHRNWYRELFQPCVAAGLISASALAGYRNQAVYIRSSRHVPPRWEVIPDAMAVLFDLLERESDAGVRAVLSHWLFGYIHPYPDGNGRMARFIMNAMLASGGYPWTVIRVEDRNAYLAALETASVDTNISAFATFIAGRVTRAGQLIAADHS